MEKSVCIFCASSTRVSEKYHNDAQTLTELLVNSGYSIKYGGGSVGLMGTVAETSLKLNGEIIGIIPQFMVDMEWANHKATELVVVEDMQERKKQMISGVDAVIALAGGIGTLDELVEVITLKQLGQYTKPVIILDTNGYYDNFLKQLEKMMLEGFMRESNKNLWFVAKTPEDVVNAIEQIKETDSSIINYAQY